MKVGDTVKVVKKLKPINDDWVKEMSSAIGKEGTIIRMSTNVTVEFDRFKYPELNGNSWNFNKKSLEVVELKVKASKIVKPVTSEDCMAEILETNKLFKELPFKAHPLQTIFDDVIAQVATGKGAERHGDGNSFMNQPWVDLAKTHGVGFLTGQSAKKLREAQSMPETDRWEREMFGVISYAAMAILYSRMENKGA